MSSASLRLMSDLKTMKQSPPEGVSASPLSDENLLVWGGTVFGPDDTSWEGGIFSMRLTFTEQYPDKPPRVRFTSEMVSVPRARRALWADACMLPLARPASGSQHSLARARLTSPRRFRAVAVPPQHLPGRHALHGPHPRQLEPHLLSLLDSDRHPLTADRSKLREPC